jgi:type II secretory pathway component GspD/PulD (secretin)
MLSRLKNKIFSLFLITTFIIGNLGLNADARAWNFDNNDEETISLQNPSIPNGNAIVSISFRKTDVQQVLRMFADRAGLNFITIGDVSGTVTMDLVDTTLANAINLVTETSKLTYIVDNHTLIVMTVDNAKQSNYSKKTIKKIPIKYVNASSVANFLNKNIFGLGKPGLSSGDIVVTDPSKNEIMIFGTQNDYLMAKKVIAKLDEKPITTTYKINNVTPKEMAQLVCDSLFPKTSNSGNTKLAGTLTGAADALSIGAGEIACKIANSSKSSSLDSFESQPITVMYNSNLGTIDLIGGSNEQIQLINEFIVLHDKKQPQALLEFVVMELNEDGSHEFSNEWHWQNNDFPVSFTGGTLSLGSIIFFGRGNTTSSSGTRLNVAGRAALWDTITWLESSGKSKVLQKPTIVVTNGKTSTIDLTQDYVEKVDSQVSESTYSQTPVTDRTYTIGKDQGMKIEILPFISPDGYITMDLKVKYATPYSSQYDYDDLGNQYLAATLLERRNLALNAIRVKNGETLVLGGLIVENEKDTISKIPLLGDIPFLGVFFRNTVSAKDKSELVIIITPRLIEESEDYINL